MIVENITDILKERNGRYGTFKSNAQLSQTLKELIKYDNANEWLSLEFEHREAIEMILHKISRIVCGDANYKDSWVDIQGYAKLGEDACITKTKR